MREEWPGLVGLPYTLTDQLYSGIVVVFVLSEREREGKERISNFIPSLLCVSVSVRPFLRALVLGGYSHKDFALGAGEEETI